MLEGDSEEIDIGGQRRGAYMETSMQRRERNKVSNGDGDGCSAVRGVRRSAGIV